MNSLTADVARPRVSSEPVCPCGSMLLEDLGPIRPPGIGLATGAEKQLSETLNPGRLYRCHQCLLGIRFPRPTDTQLQNLYAEISGQRWNSKVLLSNAQKRACQLLSRESALRVLDIGAFDGTFLEQLPDDFQLSGIEPSNASSGFSQRVTLLKPFLEPAALTERESFDVVTMFDVFEHLPDPLAGIKDALSYVRPGGRLFISTGNMDHWSFRLARGGHWYFDPITHIFIGSQPFFDRMASELRCVARFQRISHQQFNLTSSLRDVSVTLYFGIKAARWHRLPLRLMNTVPFFRRLAHRQFMPYTQNVADHIFAVITKIES